MIAAQFIALNKQRALELWDMVRCLAYSQNMPQRTGREAAYVVTAVLKQLFWYAADR